MAMRQLVRLFACVLLLGVFVSPPPVFAKLFDAHRTILENGLEVVVLPNRISPSVYHLLMYKAGSAEEVTGASGAAHYLEHVMFKGTKRYPGHVFSQTISRLGGTENAFTHYDYTGYHQQVAVRHLETMMEMEADRMTNLDWEKADIDAELEVVLEERKQRTDSSPSGILREAVRAAMYTNHPYGRPIIGWEHEIRGLNKAKIRAFYDAWYAPNNAVLVVAGNVEPDAVFAMAQRTYGQIPARDVPDRTRPFEPPKRVAQNAEKSDPRVGLASYSVQYLAPSDRDDPVFEAMGLDPERAGYALQVFVEAFSGGASSPIYRKLVIDEAAVASVGAFFGSGTHDYSSVGFWVSPNRDGSLEEAEEKLWQEVDALLEKGISAEEVTRAKRRILRSAVFARDTLTSGATIVGRGLAGGVSLDDIQNWPEAIESVTIDEINEAIRTLIKPERALVTRLLPSKDKEGQQ